MKKKILASFLALTMAVGMLSGCGSKKADATMVGGSYTFHTYASALATNWNPHTWEMNSDDAVLRMITTPWVDMTIKNSENQEYQWIFCAAESVTDVTADHTDDLTKYDVTLPEGESAADQKENYVYEIKLNKDMKWENGTAINADSYIYSMKQLLDPDMQNYRANNYYSGTQQLAGASKYFFSKKENIYVVAQDLSDPSKLYIDVYDFWNADASYTDKDGNSAPQYVSVQDTVVYGENVGDAFSGEQLYTEYGQYFPDQYPLYTTEKNESFGATYDAVGFYKVDDYTVRYVYQQPVEYNYALTDFTSNFLVYEDLYEQCKDKTGDLVTSTYGTTLDKTMSYGPYKISSIQEGKQMVYVQNENWYGYQKDKDGNLYSMTDFDVDGKKVQQYATTSYVIDVMDDDAAKQAFLKGELTKWAPSAADLTTYSLSDQLYKADETYTERFFLNTNLDALKNMDTAEGNKNSVVMSNINFRKAFSLAINRSEWVGVTPGWKPAYYLINGLYYYNIYEDPTSQYRTSEPGKQAVVNLYGVEYGDGKAYKDLDAAYDSITGYNLTEAKALMATACKELVDAGVYKQGEDIKIRIAWMAGALDDAATNQCTLIETYLNAAVEGSGFGKITLEPVGNLSTRYEDVPNGKFCIGFGAWGGAAFYPFTMFRVYMDPDYAAIHEAGCWNPDKENLTLNINGEDVTMTWQAWSNATSGVGKYANADNDTKLKITALLEENYLKQYYCIPLAATTNCTMMSYQASNYTHEYNIMYDFGGLRLMRYNYNDEEWAAYVSSQNGALSYE